MDRWPFQSFGSLRDPGTDRTPWIVAGVLLLGMLVPTAAVLWFMHAATTSESEGLRLKLIEAYRGHLKLLRAHVDAEWQATLGRVGHGLDGGDAAAAFARVVLAGDADAVIVYGPDGEPVYPTAMSPSAQEPEPGPDWWRAVAMEDAGRCGAAGAAPPLRRSRRSPAASSTSRPSRGRRRRRCGVSCGWVSGTRSCGSSASGSSKAPRAAARTGTAASLPRTLSCSPSSLCRRARHATTCSRNWPHA